MQPRARTSAAERQRMEAQRQCEQAKRDRITALTGEARHRGGGVPGRRPHRHGRRAGDRRHRPGPRPRPSPPAATPPRRRSRPPRRSSASPSSAGRPPAPPPRRSSANQRADRRAQQAQAEHEAAKTELRTAQLREQAARIEAAAQEREDYARLTPPRERSERRVARLLLAATPAGQDTQLDAVPLATIQEELSVGRTTASELRTAALGLVQGGYRP
ncbi:MULTISPECIES: hypothetical protein [Streptomyces]|uniref:Uncharacterized protein n=1 Tax=Streptomyces glycanivorans TaxID=3033808 RepID=A0ABY9J4G3_9ACTN|nr:MULTISPECIES: hypothetical protein [unclassified Streptomyces]WLQ62080.1 hypothetical protein P8A20_00065 [Streptomyces sp. Alt3]WLQ68795.1 hypothetical protein P8A20_37040 [Streptomyces sp. Alt3]WSQ82841.1 hypothetical protein OG722_00170 [Streptomyces sp. NBC_01212]WSQ89477.1 hypothetical protein OG722_36400 [Streptomyces sp. NBC_01212]